jgi:NAD(P)-dependent dehydrogenase (short-subunit alcohol dehydrogenase family)
MIPVDLTGKRALVTGGTRGIGRVISLTLARACARVAAIYRADEASALSTLQALSAISAGHSIVQADLADPEAVEQAARQILLDFDGGLEILVLDAAAGGGGALEESNPDDWRRAFDVNVHGACTLIRAALPALQPGAAIVFLSSGAGHDPLPGMAPYAVSKAAVNQLSAVLAQELGPRGIRVNTVSPGHTDKSGRDPNAHPETFTPRQREIVETTALRRLGTAQDVADVVLFFASDLSSFVTGQFLRVNGGRV